MSRRDRISARQLGGLALTASGLPVFRLCCRVSWPWVLLGGGASALLLSGLTLLQKRRPFPGGPVLRWILIPVLLSGAAAAAWACSFAFPETAAHPLAVLLLLGLAAAAARIGPAAVGRCAGVLLWVTGMLYGIVLIFSLPQLRPEHLSPSGNPKDALRVFGAQLLPGAALCLHADLKEGKTAPLWSWWAAFAAALAASVITGGILSPPLARDAEAFRTLACGVSVLGVIRRFEALVNAALLMSGFCLCALLLSAAAALSNRKRDERLVQNNFEKIEKKC